MISTADRSAFFRALLDARVWPIGHPLSLQHVHDNGMAEITLRGTDVLLLDCVVWRRDHDCSPEYLDRVLRDWVAYCIVGPA